MSQAPADSSAPAAPTGTAGPEPHGAVAVYPPPGTAPSGVPVPPGMATPAVLPPGVPPPPPGFTVLLPGMPLPYGWRHVPGRPGWIVPAAARVQLAHSFWPRSGGGASTAALSAVAVAALVGAIVLVPNRPGVGWLVTGVVLALVGLVATLRRADPLPDAAAPAPAATPPREAAPAVDSGDTDTDTDTDTDAGEASSDPAIADADDASPPDAAVASADPAADDAGPDVTPGADPAVDAAADPVVPATAAPGGAAAFARRYGERAFWTAITLALLSVGTFRAAGWLYFWCVVGAIASAAFGLAGGRTVKAMVLGVLVSIGAPFMSVSWLARGWAQTRRRRPVGPRALVVALICVALVLVFGGLFAGADAEFRHLVVAIVPRLDAADIARGVFCFVLVLLIGAGVAHLAATRPTLDSMTPTAWRSVRRFEWVAPLVVLNVLFAVFDVVQLAVFFSPDRSLVTKSHAYLRGYAHEGFWQLFAVTILTLTVLGVTARIAPREGRADRVLLRVLIGGMAVFSLVIVAAALKRLSTYEAVFGYTKLRVIAGGVALWLGLVFVFVLVASILLRAGWLPRAIAGSLAVALFAGAVANPDLYIAQHNIDRYHRIGKLSLTYMSTLSADAAPAMAALTPAQRQCAGWVIMMDLRDSVDTWRTYNAARETARKVLADVTDAGPGTHCDIR